VTGLEDVYRRESRRVFATLVRLLGDFDLAEEALHDAFVAAMEQWPADGVPANPRAWLVSTGRFRAIDALRKRARFDRALASAHVPIADHAIADHAIADHSIADRSIADRSIADPEMTDSEMTRWQVGPLADDRLRLIFTCCHPALPPDARVALTLREVCGLTTEEIARAFFVPAPTIAQRIVRAKSKIRDARIPYQVPAREDLAERLDTVLHVIYLVFNEGYSATSGTEVTRGTLSTEAIRLMRLVVELLPEPECLGLLALMLLHESRRDARTSADGEVVLLADQDRRRWDRAAIDEGAALVTRALGGRPVGPFALQAGIAAVHAGAPESTATDWDEIVGLYEWLVRLEPTPIVALNRAVAIAMRDGPAAGLALIDEILARGELSEYQFAHSARADLLRRLGRRAEAEAAYRRALTLAAQMPEQRFLRRRIEMLVTEAGREDERERRQRPENVRSHS
jgi:RNA polymerase sigma-70 factor (ECF subfamily)